MNIRDLEYFHQLSLLKSYTGVAHYFGVSKPTISYAIQRLENELNCELIKKDPKHRQVNLTQQGVIFCEHVDTILKEIKRGQQEINRSLHPLPSVGFPPIISKYIFHQMVTFSDGLDFLTKVQSVSAGSSSLVSLLRQEKLSLSLLGTLHTVNIDHVISKTLLKKSFYFVMSKNNPLSHSQCLSFKNVLDQDFILLDEHNIHLEAYKQLNSRYHNKGKILFQIDDIAVIKQLIIENKGISLLTDIALDQDDNNLVKVPLKTEDDISFFISYAYPENIQLNDTLITLINLFEKIT